MFRLIESRLATHRCTTSPSCLRCQPHSTLDDVRTLTTPWLRKLALVLGVVALIAGMTLVAEAWVEVLSSGMHAIVIVVFMVTMAASIGFGKDPKLVFRCEFPSGFSFQNFRIR